MTSPVAITCARCGTADGPFSDRWLCAVCEGDHAATCTRCRAPLGLPAFRVPTEDGERHVVCPEPTTTALEVDAIMARATEVAHAALAKQLVNDAPMVIPDGARLEDGVLRATIVLPVYAEHIELDVSFERAGVELPASILALPHGLHRGIDASIYHQRIPGVASKGALDLVHRSPAHYLAWLNGATSEESPALAFGSAYHMATLEPDRFAREYIIEPTFKGKGSVAARAAWREEHAALSWIDADDARAIAEMVATLRAHPVASQLLESGEPEVTLRWVDAATGIECKARGDWYDADRAICMDLKTTTDARAEPFTRSVASFLYHRQNAFYEDGFDAVGAWIDHFVFVAQEKTPPYAISVFTLDADAVKRGRASIRRDLDCLAECISADTWPAYPDTIQEISLPRWAE